MAEIFLKDKGLTPSCGWPRSTMAAWWWGEISWCINFAFALQGRGIIHLPFWIWLPLCCSEDMGEGRETGTQLSKCMECVTCPNTSRTDERIMFYKCSIWITHRWQFRAIRNTPAGRWRLSEHVAELWTVWSSERRDTLSVQWWCVPTDAQENWNPVRLALLSTCMKMWT